MERMRFDTPHGLKKFHYYWNGLVNVKEEEKLQVKFDSDVKSE